MSPAHRTAAVLLILPLLLLLHSDPLGLKRPASAAAVKGASAKAAKRAKASVASKGKGSKTSSSVKAPKVVVETSDDSREEDDEDTECVSSKGRKGW